MSPKLDTRKAFAHMRTGEPDLDPGLCPWCEGYGCPSCPPWYQRRIKRHHPERLAP